MCSAISSASSENDTLYRVYKESSGDTKNTTTGKATSSAPKRNFKYSMENFRAISIIFVMLCHFQSIKNSGQIGDYSTFIFQDATSWFIFISGYLFSYIESNNNFNYKLYLKKKFLNVITPYLILSIPAIAVGFIFSRPSLLNLSPTGYIIWSLTVGGNIIGPMWFVPMITIFFLLAPFFNKIFSRADVLLPVAAITLAVSIFTDRPLGSTNPLLSSIHFLGFYVLGALFCKWDEIICKMPPRVAILAITVLTIIFFVAFIFWAPRAQDSTFLDWAGSLNLLQCGKTALLIAAFLFLEKFNNKPSPVLSYIAKISFGLFFVHGFYCAAFSKFIAPQMINIPVMFFTEFFTVIIMSFVTIFIIKKMLKEKSRYVIGC